LDDEQRQVLSGISCSTKCVHLVDALAGTGKSHLARCLINRWGALADPKQGFLVVALRTRTLRQDFLETVLSDKVPHSSDRLLSSFALLPSLSMLALPVALLPSLPYSNPLIKIKRLFNNPADHLPG
jgi:hypothetical protein